MVNFSSPIIARITQLLEAASLTQQHPTNRAHNHHIKCIDKCLMAEISTFSRWNLGRSLHLEKWMYKYTYDRKRCALICKNQILEGGCMDSWNHHL